MAKGPGLTSSLRHRDFRLLMASFTASAVGSWAYNVAIVVWIFDETGSAAWVGAATIARFVPALLLSPYGGVVAERFERVRLMVLLDWAFALIMVVLALEVVMSAPVVVVIATAVLSTSLTVAYEPAAAALTPQLVGERDLGSANALRNTIDNVCVVAGPALGALMLLLGPPEVAVAVNALSFVVSALLLARMRARSIPTDVTEGGEAGVVQQMLVGVRAIASSPTARVIVAFSVIATAVFGIDTVMYVVLARDILGTGAEGYGYLLAGLGVGGVLAAPLVTRAEQLPRLSLVILAGMAAYCLPTLVFLVVGDPTVGFVAQVFRGAGTLFVDVLAMTALQRSLPPNLISRVFGAFDTLCLAAIVVGSVIASAIIGLAGLDTMIWFAGAVIPLVCLLGWPALRRMDRELAARRAELQPRIRLLTDCDLFASVADGPVAQLAASAEDSRAEPGQRVVVEGEDPDALYVVVTGRLGVTSHGDGRQGLVLADIGPGEYFGEIGLIEQIPRTATVTALEPSTLLRLDGTAFLEALTESAPSPALLDGASLRLRRTHPSAAMNRAGLDAADGR